MHPNLIANCTPKYALMQTCHSNREEFQKPVAARHPVSRQRMYDHGLSKLGIPVPAILGNEAEQVERVFPLPKLPQATKGN